ASINESERWCNFFKRLPLGRHTPKHFYQCGRNHRCGKHEIACINARRPLFDECGKNQWTWDGDAGSDGKEECDCERSDLKRKYLTRCEIGGTRRRRSEEEGRHPCQGQGERVEHANGQEVAGGRDEHA